MPKDFELHHPAGVIISRSLTREALSAFFLDKDIPHQDMKTGWVWVQLPTFQDGEINVGVSLGFDCGKLLQIALTDAHPKYATSGTDWSEKQELLRAERIGNWLACKGYPVGSYSWGIVWANYDPKGGSGSAGVRFSN